MWADGPDLVQCHDFFPAGFTSFLFFFLSMSLFTLSTRTTFHHLPIDTHDDIQTTADDLITQVRPSTLMRINGIALTFFFSLVFPLILSFPHCMAS